MLLESPLSSLLVGVADEVLVSSLFLVAEVTVVVETFVGLALEDEDLELDGVTLLLEVVLVLRVVVVLLDEIED